MEPLCDLETILLSSACRFPVSNSAHPAGERRSRFLRAADRPDRSRRAPPRCRAAVGADCSAFFVPLPVPPDSYAALRNPPSGCRIPFRAHCLRLGWTAAWPPPTDLGAKRVFASLCMFHAIHVSFDKAAFHQRHCALIRPHGHLLWRAGPPAWKNRWASMYCWGQC